jgi:hypothetical protein
MGLYRYLALGVLLSAALAAVAATADVEPWGMKPVVVEPSDSNSPLVKALSCVAEYDIYRAPVIVQAAWSRKKELSIVFFAEQDTSTKRSKPEAPLWDIQVLFGQNALARNPRVVARGISRLADGKQIRERTRLGKAVAVAVSSWDAEHVVDLPLIIEARMDERGYNGLIWRLPQVPGGFVVFEVSKDLEQYTIAPGR